MHGAAEADEGFDAPAHYVTRPVEVSVEFAPRAGSIATREGPVAHAAGDAIVTGERGERWPMPPGQLAARYSAKPGHAGRYVKKPRRVIARRLRVALDLRIAAGDMLHGKAGDWQVSYQPEGDLAIVAADEFHKLYEPAGDEGVR